MQPTSIRAGIERDEGIRQFRYEEATVKAIMRKLRLPKELKWELLDLTDGPSEVRRIEMANFQHLVSFPMWLAPRPFPKSQPLGLHDVVRDYEGTPLPSAAIDADDLRPWNLSHLPFGLVFPVAGIRHGYPATGRS